jgi:hypothetical protein
MFVAGALRGAPASITTTLRPARDKTKAADRPAAPPPITATSYEFMDKTMSGLWTQSNHRCRFRESGVH